MSAQELNGNEADQAETGHHEGLAESRLSKPDTLKCDCPNDGEGCGLVSNAIRNSCGEILWNADHFGMGAVRDHAITNMEFGYSRSHFEHDTGVRVAEGDGLVDLRADGF